MIVSSDSVIKGYDYVIRTCDKLMDAVGNYFLLPPVWVKMLPFTFFTEEANH